MSSATAAPRAAVPVSNARAEASRQNGAKSRGPKTEEGKAGRRRMRSSTACARRSISCCRTRTAPSSLRSRRPWSKSWRPSARCSACSRGRSRSPPGVWRVRTASDRAVRGTPDRAGRARARSDPRRQRHALVRDAAALPRRGHGRVLARAAHAQGAPGRAGSDGGARGCRHPYPPFGPRRGRRSSVVRNRTNPSAPPHAFRNTCRVRRPRPACCTRRPPAGCRTNRRARGMRRAVPGSRTNPKPLRSPTRP